MDKITFNLQQTEQALKDYRESLHQIQSSKQNLRTAETSSQGSLQMNKQKS